MPRVAKDPWSPACKSKARYSSVPSGDSEAPCGKLCYVWWLTGFFGTICTFSLKGKSDPFHPQIGLVPPRPIWGLLLINDKGSTPQPWYHSFLQSLFWRGCQFIVSSKGHTCFSGRLIILTHSYRQGACFATVVPKPSGQWQGLVAPRRSIYGSSKSRWYNESKVLTLILIEAS